MPSVKGWKAKARAQKTYKLKTKIKMNASKHQAAAIKMLEKYIVPKQRI